MLGTPDYMSPEQADRNESNIDTRTGTPTDNLSSQLKSERQGRIVGET
jgi:hypothetical protein